MVTGTETDPNLSTSTCSDAGASMSSICESLLMIVTGMEYVPTRFTAAQSTLAMSTAGFSESRVFCEPPTRACTLFTGCTSTYPAGRLTELCGIGTETTFVSGGLPAYTTPTQVTNAMREHSTLSFQFRRTKPGSSTGANVASGCGACRLAAADGASPSVPSCPRSQAG